MRSLFKAPGLFHAPSRLPLGYGAWAGVLCRISVNLNNWSH